MIIHFHQYENEAPLSQLSTRIVFLSTWILTKNRIYYRLYQFSSRIDRPLKIDFSCRKIEIQKLRFRNLKKGSSPIYHRALRYINLNQRLYLPLKSCFNLTASLLPPCGIGTSSLLFRFAGYNPEQWWQSEYLFKLKWNQIHLRRPEFILE